VTDDNESETPEDMATDGDSAVGTRPDRPKDELKQIAIDIHKGKIFTSFHIPPWRISQVIGLVFMAFGLAGPGAAREVIDSGVVGFYEYYDKAGPRSINGYPVFFGHHTVTQSEWEYILDVIKAMEAAEAALAILAEEGSQKDVLDLMQTREEMDALLDFEPFEDRDPASFSGDN